MAKFQKGHKGYWLGKKGYWAGKKRPGLKNWFNTKGIIPWNKINSNIQCKFCNKIFHCPPSIIKLGRKYCSRSCKAKLQSVINKGQNNPCWRGGITSINKLIRGSLEYEEWRKFCMERDLYTCQDCGQVGGMLHVDHIKPFALYSELRLDINNGRTLCIKCHRKKTIQDWKLYPMRFGEIYV